MMKRVFCGAMIAAIGVLGAGSASAATIASDDFGSYTANDSLNGLSGGSGWGGNWNSSDGTGNSDGTVEDDVIPGTGLAAQLAAVGGAVSDDENVLERTFPAQNDPDKSIYVGFLLRTTGGFDSGDFLQFYFNNGLGSANATGVSGGVRNAENNPYFVRTGDHTKSTNSTTTFHTDDVTRSIVLRIGKSGTQTTDPYNTVAMFVDQTTEVNPAASRSGNASNTVSTISTFHARIFSFEDGQKVFVDSIKIADTYAEAYTVPEPATLAVATIGLLTLAVRRPRRRR